ncbi:hypothetical protein G4Q83_20045 [Xanthomonas theicola]|nr:hypothetical protein G4Q83_20045 [Xanthomonas theicola]
MITPCQAGGDRGGRLGKRITGVESSFVKLNGLGNSDGEKPDSNDARLYPQRQQLSGRLTRAATGSTEERKIRMPGMEEKLKVPPAASVACVLWMPDPAIANDLKSPGLVMAVMKAFEATKKKEILMPETKGTSKKPAAAGVVGALATPDPANGNDLKSPRPVREAMKMVALKEAFRSRIDAAVKIGVGLERYVAEFKRDVEYLQGCNDVIKEDLAPHVMREKILPWISEKKDALEKLNSDFAEFIEQGAFPENSRSVVTPLAMTFEKTVSNLNRKMDELVDASPGH